MFMGDMCGYGGGYCVDGFGQFYCILPPRSSVLKEEILRKVLMNNSESGPQN